MQRRTLRVPRNHGSAPGRHHPIDLSQYKYNIIRVKNNIRIPGSKTIPGSKIVVDHYMYTMIKTRWPLHVSIDDLPIICIYDSCINITLRILLAYAMIRAARAARRLAPQKIYDYLWFFCLKISSRCTSARVTSAFCWNRCTQTITLTDCRTRNITYSEISEPGLHLIDWTCRP